MVGPNYQRPKVSSPPQFRAAQEQPSQASLGDVKWFNLFERSGSSGPDQRSAAGELRRPHRRSACGGSGIARHRNTLALSPQMNLQADANRTGVNSPLQSTGVVLGSQHGRSDCSGSFGVSRKPRAQSSSLPADNQRAVTQSLVAESPRAYSIFESTMLNWSTCAIHCEPAGILEPGERTIGRWRSEMLEVDQAKSLVASAEATATLLEKRRSRQKILSATCRKAAGRREPRPEPGEPADTG